MSADELRACPERHRTPLVMQCIDDYLAGRRFPLDFVHTHSVGPNNRDSRNERPSRSTIHEVTQHPVSIL